MPDSAPGIDHTFHKYKFQEWLGSNPTEMGLGMLADKTAGSKSAVANHQMHHNQLVKRSDHPTLFSTAATSF